ncbi:hypothetical protein MNBD_GAMMA05-1241 [hydrothermal vent metagenome]|uniref:Methanolan biosynthesis EpsI domain-containing protein n=1 Tax=hydrothermal vent metagenome TaxID=652676 RepID=A0A3B0WCM6_9ZZZZ
MSSKNSEFHRSQMPDSWRLAGASIALLLLLTGFLYQQTIVFLLGIWNQLETGNYTHGYLVLLISVYLINNKREQLKALPPCPSYSGLFSLITACMLWLIAALVDIEMLQTIALLLILLSLVWSVLGRKVAGILLFPILYIGFAIPVWFPLSPVLQEVTADVVFWLIRIIEVPAYRLENMIVLPGGRLSVEEACGGLNYLLAALTLGTLYGYLNYTKLSVRLFIVLVSAGAAVLVNILRVFIVVYLGYETDMQHPYVEDHLSLGWYLFAGLVLLLLIIDIFWHWLHKSNSQVVQNIDEKAPLPCKKGKTQFLIFVFSAAFMLVLAPATVSWLGKQQAVESSVFKPAAFVSIGQWSAVASDDDWVPKYGGAITRKMRFIDENNRQMHLFLGVYHRQTQGQELINDLNAISDGKIWHSKYQRAKIQNVGGRQVFEQLIANNEGVQRLVWYWYHVAERDTINKYYAKILQVVGLVTGVPQASVVAIATHLDAADPEKTREKLDKFVSELTPQVNRWIDDN